MTAQRFAFFDFDDTLCRGDSIVPYLLFCIRRGLAPRRQLLRAVAAFFRQKQHPELASQSKSVSLSFIKGRAQEEMDDVARDFFREVLVPRFFREGQAELQACRTEGCRIVIVSASAEVYMRVLPEFMPVDEVICTRCGVNGSGRYTGEICDNCKGDQKPLRIREYLRAQGLDADWTASRAYGDSPSDAPMLSMVGVPTLVDPANKLLQKLPDARRVHWR